MAVSAGAPQSPVRSILHKNPPKIKSGQNRAIRRSSRLTLRILAVNLVAPFVLLLGILYMGQYQDNLVRAELETVKAEAQVFAGAIAEGAVKPVEQGRPFLFAKPVEIETLVPELARRMVRRLGETTDSRTLLFNVEGKMIGDSEQLLSRSALRNREPMGPPAPTRRMQAVLLETAKFLSVILPHNDDLEPYPKIESKQAVDYPDAPYALEGHVSGSAFRGTNGKIILSAAAPVQKIRQVMGVVVLTREGKAIEQAMNQVRFEILTIFMGSLSVTIFLSLYLAGIIGRPLKKLARAAEQIRHGQNRQVEIPDLSHRRDEIGELSLALRAMTHALWDRMDTIERFAADVSHEIKNPLTSLRSAVETAAIVKSQKDKDKLMEIIQHDVQRLDRLITDISNASRLDAELSRDEMLDVDIYLLLHKLADAHKNPMERSGLRDNFAGRSADDSPQIRLMTNGTPPILVRGNETRLAQVFENLISNALSFSPEKGLVTITISVEKTTVRITVDDQGPGIPENKLGAIFERFYSERPKHEAYGRHSGLGLSIAHQIVTAHGGKIWAENIQNNGETVTGARFTVILNRA
ncbi:MAG: stimulus-sensing domain-containing protein [Micavibrio aeruginosavorus]|uniref:histidine kinase n=1 Tax=Micavibrio aeruginosavorus TaxID=349221 RepID=A0A7T5UHC0_9BACT|nr:MAG: stimulus-sensing domain-containing protein [Micavibrio aeruginosavorus]